MPQTILSLIESFANDILEIAREAIMDELDQRTRTTKKGQRRPDRVSADVLSRVQNYIETPASASVRTFTSQEVADGLGIGETSARNALKNLCASGKAQHFSSGRRIVYRFVDSN